MDPRITANLEVFNSTTVTIAGIWMGSRSEFIAALPFIDDVFQRVHVGA